MQLAEQCGKWQENAVKNEFTLKDIKEAESINGRRLSEKEVNKIIRKKGVCKRCEGICYRDGSGYRCPRCGWMGSTISVEEYKEKEYYR